MRELACKAKRTFETNVSEELLQFERTFVGGSRSGFLSFGVDGHDAVFGRGSVLEASTDRFEKSICAQATASASPPLPRNIIAPDAQMTPPPSHDVPPP